jgi:hypothetical protein
MQHFLGGYPTSDPFWDFRPDADRFTLREMIAHLADWNDVFLGRFQRTLKEHEPLLPNCDESQFAIDHDYAHSDPQKNLARFAQSREGLNQFIKDLKPEDWDRVAEREGVGKITLSQHIALMVGHDGYHLCQAMDYNKSL